MYGQASHAIIPTTVAAGLTGSAEKASTTGQSMGVLGYSALALALITAVFMIIALVGLARRRSHARP